MAKTSVARVAATAALCLSSAIASANPRSTIMADVSYATLDDAARAALHLALPLSAKHEYGGAVLLIEGRYYVTDPVTSGHSHDVSYDVVAPRGAVLAGVYHTHPCDARSSVFSPNDGETVRSLGVPSYMADACTGVIRVLTPKDVTQARRVRGRNVFPQGNRI